MTGGLITELLEGSTLGFAPGEFTDDTQMVLSVLAAYRRGTPPVLGAAADEFGAWLASDPPDVGTLTRQAISGYGRDGVGAGFSAWVDSGYQSAGNGGLMRVAGAVIAGRTGEALLRETVELTALTHADPRSLLSCVVAAATLEALAQGASPSTAWTAALSVVDGYPVAEVVAASYGQEWGRAVAARLPGARAAVHATIEKGLAGEPGPQGGFVLETLQAAVHFSHAPDLLSGVGAIAARGNDSDTAGAVAGALLGARGMDAPRHLLAGIHSLHRWSLWAPPGAAEDLEALVPA